MRLKYLQNYKNFLINENKTNDTNTSIIKIDQNSFNKDDINGGVEEIYSHRNSIDEEMNDIILELRENYNWEIDFQERFTVKKSKNGDLFFGVGLSDISKPFYLSYRLDFSGDKSITGMESILDMLYDYAKSLNGGIYIEHSYVKFEEISNFSEYDKKEDFSLYFLDRTVKYQFDYDEVLNELCGDAEIDDKGVYFKIPIYELENELIKNPYLEDDAMMEKINSWYNSSNIYDPYILVTYDLSDESKRIILDYLENEDDFDSYRENEDDFDTPSQELREDESDEILIYYFKNIDENTKITEFWHEYLYPEAETYIYNSVYEGYINKLLLEIKEYTKDYEYDKDTSIVKIYPNLSLEFKDIQYTLLETFSEYIGYLNIGIEFDGYIGLDTEEVNEWVKEVFID